MEALENRSRAGAVRSHARPQPSPGSAHRRHHRAATPGVDRVVALLKTIGHPLRFRIVALLCDGEHRVGAMARQLGAPQPIVSQQLRILRAQELVAVTRAGGFARYHLRDGAVRDLIRSAKAFSGALAAHATHVD